MGGPNQGRPQMLGVMNGKKLADDRETWRKIAEVAMPLHMALNKPKKKNIHNCISMYTL